MSEPNIYDDVYKLIYTVQPELSPEDVNQYEDCKIYHYAPQTTTPFVVLGSSISEALHLEIEAARLAGKEVIILSGAPINPPPYPGN